MAYGKRYYSSYKSNNNIDYYLEIFAKDFSALATEITLGEGGCVISYETEENDRFSPILSSNCSLPFLVENLSTQGFIELLRTTYKEKDIYLHLYKATSSTYSSTKPIWSGFCTMDLSTGEDAYFPYVVNLKFIDGLSLLKEIDFVDLSDTSTPSGSTIPLNERTQGNYAAQNMYWGPASFIYWIRQCLNKTGCAISGTDGQGVTEDYGFTTAVNWYNKDMPNTNQSSDPLKLTRGKATMFHSKDENGVFYPENTYDVLKTILRHWGARIIYWEHEFYIVQIAEYITDESGTIDNPDNINSRQYTRTGAAIGNQDNLGNTYSTRYNQDIKNNKISKLTGTKYNYLPPIIKANANFLSLNSFNNYGGFPFATTRGVPTSLSSIVSAGSGYTSPPTTNLATTGGSGNGLRVDIVISGGAVQSVTIRTAGSGYTLNDSITIVGGNNDATFTIASISSPVTSGIFNDVFQGTILNPSSTDFLYISIPLNWAWDMTNTQRPNGHQNGWWARLKFNLYCTQNNGGTITTYYLQYNSSDNSYYWEDSANWSPLGNEAPSYIISSRNLVETDYVGFNEQVTFIDSSGSNISLTGEWDFYIGMDHYGTSSSNPGSFYCRFSGYGTSNYIKRNPTSTNPTLPNPTGTGANVSSGTVSWSNSLEDNSIAWNGPTTLIALQPSGYNTGSHHGDRRYNWASPLKGFLQFLSNTVSDSFGTTFNTTITNSTNTEIFSFGNLVWGDTVLDTSRGVLQINDGSAWDKSDVNGKWGRGILTGEKNFTQMLIDEFISGQVQVVISPTMRLVVGDLNKEETEGTATRPRYVNPIGRLREFDETEPDPVYFFRRGSFYTLYDEWDYEGYQILRDTPLTNTNTNNIGMLGGSQNNLPVQNNLIETTITTALMQNSQVAYVRNNVASTGSNVAVNGNFNVATGWTLGSGWSIDTTAKKALFTATGSTSDLTQSVLTQGLTYQINFTVVVTAGSLLVKAGSSGTSETITTSGDYSIYLNCEGSSIIKFQAGTTFTGNITYITLRDQKSLSSLPINAIGNTVFKTDDTFNLINSNSGEIIPLTVTSNQSASDETISVTAVPLYDDIAANSVLLINQDDLSAQYQNKTKGTVAGFTIDADGIAKGGVEITGWLDSDTMSGATANNVPTAESVKAYVDAQVGASDTLAEVLVNGNTTGGTDIIVSHNDQLKLGDDGEFQIWHQSGANGNSFIDETNTGDLYIRSNSAIRLSHYANNTASGIFNPSGNVELYYNTTKKFETTNTGISITGGGVFTGQVTIPATPVASTDAASKGYVDAQVGTADTLQEVTDLGNTTTNSVMIGSSSSPGARLEVSSDSNIATIINSTSTFTFIDIENDGANRVQIGNASDGDFIIRTSDVERARITSGGNVGIGTTSPDSLLEISSDSVTDFLKLTSAGSGANPIKLIFEKSAGQEGIIEYNRNGDLEIYNTDGDGGVMIDGSTSAGADFYVNNSGNTILGGSLTGTTATFSGQVTIPATPVASTDAASKGYVDAQVGTADTLQEVTDLGNTTTNSITIGSSSSPTSKLEIIDTTVGTTPTDNDNLFIKLSNKSVTSAGETWGIGFNSNNVGTDKLGAFVSAFGHYSSNYNTSLIFGTRDTSGNAAEKMRLTSAGYLGIGTTSPSSLLHLSSTTPIITNDASDTSVAHGIEFKNSGALDAYIKQKPSTGEFEFNVGRSSTWGGDFLFTTDTYDSYRITKDLHRWYILGSEKMRLTSGGNLLIGTTSDGGSRLQVVGVSYFNGNVLIENNNELRWKDSGGTQRTILELTNTNDLYFGGSFAGSLIFIGGGSYTERARISDSGNFLIATTTDDGSSKLQVDGDIRLNEELKIYNSGTDYWGIQTDSNGKLEFDQNGTLRLEASSGEFDFKVPILGTTATFSGDINLVAQNKLRDSANSNKYIELSDSSANVVYSAYANHVWRTYNGSSYGERLRLTSAGNLLIGTTTDDGSNKLQVNGTALIENSGNGELAVKRTSGATIKVVAQSARGQVGTTSNNEFQLITNSTARLTITTSGNTNFNHNVSIGGTAGAVYKLDVVGKARVQSVLELDDVLTLNAISTPSDPASGKSSIYMDSSDGAIKVKINVGGTVVTRTIASFE